MISDDSYNDSFELLKLINHQNYILAIDFPKFIQERSTFVMDLRKSSKTKEGISVMLEPLYFEFELNLKVSISSIWKTRNFRCRYSHRGLMVLNSHYC